MSRHEALPGIFFEGALIYLKHIDAVIISDPHVGKREALARSGVLYPDDEIGGEIRKVISRKPRHLIVNGDFLNDFGRVTRKERVILSMLEMLGSRVTFLVGNHDTMLRRLNIKCRIADYFLQEGILVCHGDKVIDKKARVIIIGHDHPAIELSEGGRKEKFKVYLVGKYEASTLIVMPSLTKLSIGTDILSSAMQSPYLKSIENLSIYVCEDKITHLGKVSEVRNATYRER